MPSLSRSRSNIEVNRPARLVSGIFQNSNLRAIGANAHVAGGFNSRSPMGADNSSNHQINFTAAL